MVTTASASFTLSSVEVATLQPFPAARAVASCDRSKAWTSCPALTRLAAIPPPILPSPMKAMRVMSASFPVRFPLADEGSHSFFLVLGPEQAVEQPPFEDDATRKTHLL